MSNAVNDLESTTFVKNVDDNIRFMEQYLRVDANFDILERKIKIGGKIAGFFFIDGFVQEDAIEKMVAYFYTLKEDDLKDIDTFLLRGIPYTEVETIKTVGDAVTKFLSGVSILFIDGFTEAVAIDCRTYPMRSVSEPWKDRVLRGSRDGFVETLVANAALMRRRIRDPKFSVEMFGVGTRSRSDVAVCYIEDKADEKLVKKIKQRIQSIDVESLTMNMESLAECLLPVKWINPFPKFKYSERPDTAAAAVLDGNVVIMVDNSPAVMIVPTSIFDVMEEPDDFNFSPMVGTYLRWSRFLFTIVTFLLTPTWLLLITHPQWVPAWLKFITVADEITVPILLQLLLLELATDGLKLAAVNTPTMLSTPLSIVAGIVVGEYAVNSGWFNPEALLYMAVVSVGTYSQASFEMGYAIKFMRVLTLVLTQIFGLAGYIIGIASALLAVIFNRTITGKSYIYPLIPFSGAMLKRKLVRVRLPHKYN
ncbi:MAG: spore germination protein [Eubacteriales bacterium]|nr:spore germination protein [Eubacteriales bacterium]